ncbi:MAG: carboxypeptidase-like regulatory domain-containing protein [Usitatibacter sp.]
MNMVFTLRTCLSLVCLAMGSTWAYDLRARARIVPFDVTGIVRDEETKMPIAGAYVIAGYHVVESGPGAVAQWCVRTRGTRTAADGRFRFPIEKLDGLSPASLAAIKEGHFLSRVEYPDRKTFKKQDAKAYANREIFLAKQNPKEASISYGTQTANCYHAKTAADVAAGIEFLKIQLQEMKRLHLRHAGIANMIENLESIGAPAKSPAH